MSDKRNNQYSVHCTIGSCTEYKEYNVFLAFFSVYTNVIATDMRKCNLISRIVII